MLFRSAARFLHSSSRTLLDLKSLLGLKVFLAPFTFCLESLGFFDRLIFGILELCKVRDRIDSKDIIESSTKNSKKFSIYTYKLFLLLLIAAAICSAVFANDGAILIFTPLVIGIFRSVKNHNIDSKIFWIFILLLFMISFICEDRKSVV